MFPSEFVLNVFLEKRGRTTNGGFNSGHGLAGACLVRLTRTPIVILYAQPKTPTYFPRFAAFSAHKRRSIQLEQTRTTSSGRDYRLRPGGTDGRDLCRAREPQSAADRCAG